MASYTSPTGLTWHQTAACRVLRNLGTPIRGDRGLVPCSRCCGTSELPHERRLAQTDLQVADARANPHQMPWATFADVLFTAMRKISNSGHRLHHTFHQGPTPTSGQPTLQDALQVTERLLTETYPQRLTSDHHQHVQQAIQQLAETHVRAISPELAADNSRLWIQYFQNPTRMLRASQQHGRALFSSQALTSQSSAGRPVNVAPADVIAASLLGVQTHTDTSHQLRTFAAVPRPAVVLLQWVTRNLYGTGSDTVQLVGPAPADTCDLRMLLQTCTQVHANADHTPDSLPDVLAAAHAALT